MNARFALLALPLALAACDDAAMRDFRLPWQKAPAEAAAPATAAAAPSAPTPPAKPAIPEPTGASPAKEPLQVAGDVIPVATADSETASVRNLTAGGEGWSVAVNGTGARLERGGKTSTVTVRRIAYKNGIEYIGTLNDKPFVLHLTGADCGGQPMTASLRADGKTLNGCASPAAAAAAPAKKKPV